MDVTIRNATVDDLESMVALLHELFSMETDFSPDRRRQRRGFSLMLDGCRKHRCIKVADVRGEVTGMCTAQILISTAQGGAEVRYHYHRHYPAGW